MRDLTCERKSIAETHEHATSIRPCRSDRVSKSVRARRIGRIKCREKQREGARGGRGGVGGG